jgi:DNA-binding transcriptional LysR family regulator
MPLELQQLRQVIALAEHGSFVRAAAALHISQPALSRSIQNLEQHFGSDLFLRSSGGVVPTDLGRLYIERARDVLRMADELDRDAVTRGTLGTGRVAVGGGPFPAESFLGPAAVRFIEQYPRVSVQLHARDWDTLLHELRGRELDFFVAETSTLQREAELEIAPMPSAHEVHFVARAGHPLAGRGAAKVEDVFAYPFVTPSRIPPRVLDPMLAAHRAGAAMLKNALPFPAIQCTGLAPVKRILTSSDAVSASILSCVAAELELGQLVLLGTAPWLHLHYGIVSLKGRPWTQAAERFREYVLQAERQAAAEEERLLQRFRPGARRASSRARKAARGGGPTDVHGDD